MKENTKGTLIYGAIVAAALSSTFLMATGNGRTDITVNPQTREITEKNQHTIAAPYYSDTHTITTVYNLGRETKTVTDDHLTTAGITVTDKSETKTSELTPDDLFDLRQKSVEAAALISICHPNIT